MGNIFDSNISIEKLAAFFDGNLSNDEMLEISNLIENNKQIKEFISIKEMIDTDINDWTSNNDIEFDLPPELSSLDFELPNLDNFYFDGDIFSKNDTLYNQRLIQTPQNMKENYDSLEDHRIFGEEGLINGHESNPFIQQAFNDTCAIRSQQIIMRDYGVDVSESDLRDIAMDNGWYTPNGGTSMTDVGNLLHIAGIDCHQSVNNTVYDLVSELSQGHRVIVGIDSGELWKKSFFGKFLEKAEDYLGIQGADHALIVAGVDVNPNDPKDIRIILTDPGSGNLRVEYKIEDFLDAWKDSKCFMVSTEEPAPYQFDPITNREIPSGFHSNYAFNSFVFDNGYQLSPSDMTIPDDYLATYSETSPIDWQDYHLDDSDYISVDMD